MRMDLGMDDKTLLDLASQPWTPRTTRQRSANPSAHGSTKLGALATTDDIAEMRLDGGETFGDDEDEEEEDEEEDSASVYQDSASVSPQPSRPSASHANISSSNLARTTASSKASARGYPSSHLEATPSSVSLAKSSDASSTLTTTTNKRGRKPAPAASRGAREQARKTNHSKIEKRRREKINEALSTLREMVPVGIAGILEQHDLASPGASPALSAVGAATVVGVGSPIIPGGGKKKGGEKEFKLEVLERTVIFVKYLLDRVNELEAQADANPKSPDTNLTIVSGSDSSISLPLYELGLKFCLSQRIPLLRWPCLHRCYRPLPRLHSNGKEEEMIHSNPLRTFLQGPRLQICQMNSSPPLSSTTGHQNVQNALVVVLC